MTPNLNLFSYNAAFIRAVDGDTVVMDIDLGFKIRQQQTLRLWKIDTPERGQPGYKEAKTFVHNALTNAETIIVETHKDKAGKYGRYLASIYYAYSDGVVVCLNKQLLEKNLGKLYK